MYDRAFISQFYKNHIDMTKAKENGPELSAPCPCHKDKNPSFSVNLDTGTFICFAPKCSLSKGGNIYQFKAIIEDIPVAQAKEDLDSEWADTHPETPPRVNRGRTTKDFPYKQEDLDKYTEDLFKNAERLQYLKKQCLWTEETIKKFNIGWDGSRYSIPIKEHGRLVNIRRYLPNGNPKFTNVASFGGARLFPIENTEYKELVLVEGEKDCILANQLGFNAISVTGGAGTFKTQWKQYFMDKDVVICYDIDEAGREGANKVISNISNISLSLKNVLLPITEPANGDFTDYFLTGKTPQDFRALIDATPVEKPRTQSVIDIPNTVYTASLSKINENNLFYKRCRTRVRVVGKDTSPFIVPQKICVTCSMDNRNGCFNCGVADMKGRKEIILNETTPHILELIECTAADKKRILHELFNIPTCRKFTHTEEGHQPIIHVSVIPSVDEMDYEDNETLDIKYVEREMYYIGQDLDNNVDYEIEAIAVPSAKDQTLVHLGYKVEHSDSSVESFHMTPEIRERLTIFQCDSRKE